MARTTLLTVSILCWLWMLKAFSSSAKPLSVMITAFPAAGHITPAANLGEELVRRGHTVTLCTMDVEGSDLPKKRTEAAGMKYLSAGNASFSVARMQDVIEKSVPKDRGVASIYQATREGWNALHWIPEVSNAIGRVLDHEN